MAFDNMAPGDKYLWYSTIEDGNDIEHPSLDLRDDESTSPDVAALESGLVSAGLAFLDAHLRSHQAAVLWLLSNQPPGAGGGGADWQRR